MITYTTGNLLEAPAEALVNTVNEVGVMGKGVALMFKEAFPESAEAYRRASANREVRVGHVLVTSNQALVGPRWILHFPTKRHWRNPSRIEWIREGLRDLVRVVKERRIESIALPPLGCGNGGLEWSRVRREIEAAASDMPDVRVFVYEPSEQFQTKPKRSGLVKLTPARALIAELVRRYAVLDLECTNLEVQKLAWFLERAMGQLSLSDPLDLRFSANKYGPYAERLRHLLNGLDGSYLHCNKRLSEAGPFDLIWFEASKRDVVQRYLKTEEAQPYLPALERTSLTIDGFESPLGMELLATVDWLIRRMNCEPTLDGIKKGLKLWPGGKAAAERKFRLFDDRMLSLALGRLQT